MEGFAPLDDAPVPPADDRVEVLSSAGEWTDSREPLHRIWESYTPVHVGLHRASLPPEQQELADDDLRRMMAGDGRIGAGLGRGFAERVADLTRTRVGLIPAAHGGTSLEQWSPGFGGAPRTSTSTLYGSLLDRVARAGTRADVQLSGVLWYQGESDATPARSVDYADRFARWVDDLRGDLGIPDLPVLIVQLGRFAGAENGEITERSWDQVREAQRTAPGRTPGVGVASAIDLELCDPIHIGADGLRRLGARLATLAVEGGSGPDVDRVSPAGANASGHVLLRVSFRGVRGGWAGTRFPGFAICEGDGAAVRRVSVVEAQPDRSDESSILITTSATTVAELAGLHLSYGSGFDPVCTAVDERHLALSAFGPQVIE